MDASASPPDRPLRRPRSGRAGERSRSTPGASRARPRPEFDRAYGAGLRLAGVDEVGRGALAGPLVAGAVILPPDLILPELDDSKVLPPARRLWIAREVTRRAVAWSVVMIPAAAVDAEGIQRANYRALREAVEHLPVRPDLVLSDGWAIPGLDVPQRAVVGGDRKSPAIAAAACLAKVVRDAWMQRVGQELFPGYGFERHVGYGTPEHWHALRRMGPTPLHRRTFLRRYLEAGGEGVRQLELWRAGEVAAATEAGRGETGSGEGRAGAEEEAQDA